MDGWRTPSLLDAIRRQHEAHDARLAATEAIRRAEVVLMGVTLAADELEVLAARVAATGGHIAPAPGPETRYAVAGPAADPEQLVRASDQGVLVIALGDLEAMLDAFIGTTGVRLSQAGRESAAAEAAKRRSTRMQTRQREAEPS